MGAHKVANLMATDDDGGMCGKQEAGIWQAYRRTTALGQRESGPSANRGRERKLEGLYKEAGW